MTNEPTRAIVARPALPSQDTYSTIEAWSKVMAGSGFFKDARNAAQAAVKILYGTELGFSVGASMAGIHIIEGRPTIGAGLMAAAVKRSPKYDYRVIDHTDTICRLQFRERGEDGEWFEAGTSEFSVTDAEHAGLYGRPSANWEKYPRNMVFARAMSNGVAWYCPDVFEAGRVYTAEELNPDLEVDPDGTVIDAQVIAPPESAPAQARAQRPAAATPAPGGIGDGIPPFQNVGQFMTWATQYGDQQGYPLNSRTICRVLAVERPSDIRDLPAAAQAIVAEVRRALGGGDGPPPAEAPPAEPIEGEVVEGPGHITTEVTALLRDHEADMDQPQKVEYLDLVNDGLAPEVAMEIVLLPEAQRSEYDQMVNEGGMDPEDALAVVQGEDDQPPGEDEGADDGADRADGPGVDSPEADPAPAGGAKPASRARARKD